MYEYEKSYIYRQRRSLVIRNKKWQYVPIYFEFDIVGVGFLSGIFSPDRDDF